jgi:nitric oxide reductase NorD protein
MSADAAPESAGDGVRLADVQRVLALFAHGVAGHSLHLQPHEPRPEIGRESVIGTDGSALRVPAEIGAFPSPRHNLGAYLVVVLHQVGQLLLGTFTFAVEHEVDRWPSRGLLRFAFVKLEDRRIDLAIRRGYPGAAGNLDRFLAHARSFRPPPASLPLRDGLAEALAQHSLGAASVGPLPGDTTGLLERMLAVAGIVEAERATAMDSARAAIAICALFDELGPRDAPADPIDLEEAVDSSGPATQRAPNEPGGSTFEEERDALGLPADDLDGHGIELRGTFTAIDIPYGAIDGQAGTLPDLVTESGSPDASPPDSDERDGSPSPSPVLAGRRSPFESDRSFLYDEWDYHRQGYLKGWCRVYEHRLRGDDHQFLAGVRRRHADLAVQVRRSFSFVRPESWHRVHSTNEGEEFDLDAVIDAMVDRRAGHVTDEHLYIRRERGQREVATAFLLDMSGSTSAPVPDPDAPPAPDFEDDEDPFTFGLRDAPPSQPERRVLDIAKDALALMGEALQILGDEYAIYGFSGEGRDGVEFYVAKELHDAPSTRAWASLAAMEPRRYTRMGPAIRHAATKLGAVSARTKLLIVVSDGYPQDRDYGPVRGDNDYGLHDTARALQEAERARIATFCVTVDPAGHDYLRTMCAEDRYLVIDDVRALPRELSKLYRGLSGARPRVSRPN